MTEAKLLEKLRLEYGSRGGQARLAEQLSLSRAYISDVFNGKRPIGKQISDLYGFERVTTFRRKRERKTQCCQD